MYNNYRSFCVFECSVIDVVRVFDMFVVFNVREVFFLYVSVVEYIIVS